MGHRALVADARVDTIRPATDDYVVRYSHWGALEFHLADAIATDIPPATTFGSGEAPASCTESSGTSRGQGTATDVGTFAAEFVDPVCHEAAFVVSPDADVAAYLPLSATVGPGTVDAGGVLLALRDEPSLALDARGIRAWTRANRPASRDTAKLSSSIAGPSETHDRFHDVIATAFPDRELHRIPPASERTPQRARGPITPGD